MYNDVESLTAAGLLKRDGGRLTAPYETILAEMSLVPHTGREPLPWLTARRKFPEITSAMCGK